MFEIKFTPEALRNLKNLQVKFQRQIAKKIEFLRKDPFSSDSIKLKGHETFYRIRSGDYRIIYEILDKELIILVIKIGHRRDIYDKLR